MMIFLFFWLFKTSNKLEKWGILIIIAGAISNIGDRLYQQLCVGFYIFTLQAVLLASF